MKSVRIHEFGNIHTPKENISLYFSICCVSFVGFGLLKGTQTRLSTKSYKFQCLLLGEIFRHSIYSCVVKSTHSRATMIGLSVCSEIVVRVEAIGTFLSLCLGFHRQVNIILSQKHFVFAACAWLDMSQRTKGVNYPDIYQVLCLVTTIKDC